MRTLQAGAYLTFQHSFQLSLIHRIKHAGQSTKILQSSSTYICESKKKKAY